MKVFTSASAPWAGTSFPFHWKFRPAALPVFTTISRAARTEVWAGAIRGSAVTSWPSARTEIQEFSVARIINVRGAAGFPGELASGSAAATPASFSDGFSDALATGLAGERTIGVDWFGGDGIPGSAECALAVWYEAQAGSEGRTDAVVDGGSGADAAPAAAPCAFTWREWRFHTISARTMTSPAIATILHGIPLSRSSRYFFRGGRTCSARGNCSSGSSSAWVEPVWFEPVWCERAWAVACAAADGFDELFLDGAGAAFRGDSLRVGSEVVRSAACCAATCVWRTQARYDAIASSSFIPRCLA